MNTFLGIEDHVLIYLSFLTTGFLVHIFYNDILHYSQLAHFFSPLTLCASSHFVCLFIVYCLHLTQQHRQLEYKLHESRNSVVFTAPFSVLRWFQECSRTHLLNEWPICTLEHCLFYVSVPQMCDSELCIQ